VVMLKVVADMGPTLAHSMMEVQVGKVEDFLTGADSLCGL